MNLRERPSRRLARGVGSPLSAPQVTVHVFRDDGAIPNSQFPLLVYRRALSWPGADREGVFAAILRANGWVGSWVNGIYRFHHYHSTAHEVLGVLQGSAQVQFGGESGLMQSVQAGDVVVIPAGVGHKNLGCSADFSVMGAYPPGQHWDMCYGKPGERPQADENIARVPLPLTDPVYGPEGPLLEHWKK